MLTIYFENLKTTIQNYSSIFNGFSSDIKPFSDVKAFIKGEITFSDGSILDFAEVKDVTLEVKPKYRYHYMDKDKNLIFRYDNAAHHKEIATFPHHKHTPKGVEESNEPTIKTIMKEIEGIISR